MIASKLAKSAIIAALSLAPAFTSVAQDEAPVAQQTNPSFDVAARVKDIKLVKNPLKECVVVTDPYSTSPQKGQAEKFLEILDRIPITQKMADEIRKKDKVLCFLNVNSDYADDLPSSFGGAHYPDVTIVNNDFPEGCKVSTLIHEEHHGLQAGKGYFYPVENLNRKDQRRLFTIKELDANVIQILAGWMLSSEKYNKNPYPDAHDCNKNKIDNLMGGDFTGAAAKYVESSGKSLDPGQETESALAYNIYANLVRNRTIQLIYNTIADQLYACPGACFREEKSLGETSIPDLKQIGAIHFDKSYLLNPRPESPHAR